MTKKDNTMELQPIQSKIMQIRDVYVILDFDLAEMYQVATKVLNQSVKRNIKRFPSDFMFQLTFEEWDNLKSQIVTSSLQIHSVLIESKIFQEIF